MSRKMEEEEEEEEEESEWLRAKRVETKSGMAPFRLRCWSPSPWWNDQRAVYLLNPETLVPVDRGAPSHRCLHETWMRRQVTVCTHLTYWL